MNRAVFLDRDGTINENVGYCSKVEDFHIFPWTLEAVKLLKSLGFKLVVITNQSGVGRGLFTLEILNLIHQEMLRQLPLDAVLFCPHVPEGSCNCRKPRLGMIKTVKVEYNIDLEYSYVIGDMDEVDGVLGRRLGCKTFIVDGFFTLLDAAKEIERIERKNTVPR